MGRSNKSDEINIGDLVWCVHDFYKLPLRGIIIKIIELNPVYNCIDCHYEVLIVNKVHTLHEEEVYKNEDCALSYQIMQIKGHNKI